MRRLGAWTEKGKVHVRTWAPRHHRVDLELEFEGGGKHTQSMTSEPDGLWTTAFEDPGGDVRWKLILDGHGPYPDPLSCWQPDGIHGSSALDRVAFPWTDHDWRGVSMRDLVIYELHVGTATAEGTFESLIAKLDDLKALGVTAIELMPVAAFPGERNWGYDGVFWNAPAACYGGPTGLRKLVDAAHSRGLAVLLDVVFNHFGPDGNYLWVTARDAFTDRYKTPWGEAIDWAKPVMREMAFSCAERWIRDFHIDGLRLDATHSLFHETDAPHFLRDIAARARSAAPDRTVVVIAEDERNKASLLLPAEQGGDALDAVWADDFHHAMRRLLAKDSDGYFADYEGCVEEVAHALNRGWIYEGQRSRFHNATRGTPSDDLPADAFVHCLQNHDQIGNRAFGDRLGESVEPAALRAATAVLLLSPHVPLLFMGQEWNASTPFPFFTDHNDELGRAVTKGRRREFASFASFGGDLPDPQAEETFESARLNWSERTQPPHAQMLDWHRRLLTLRHTHPALKGRCEARPVGDGGLVIDWQAEARKLTLVVSFNAPLQCDLPEERRLILSSDAIEFGGRASAVLHLTRVTLGGAGAVVLEST